MVAGQDNDLRLQHVKEKPVGKPADQCAPCCLVRDGKEKRGSGEKLNYLRNLIFELVPEPRALSVIPLPGRPNLRESLWPKRDREAHASPAIRRRASAQGTPDEGFAKCSARRRSNSARCSSVSAKAASASGESARLSQMASTRSSRSGIGNLRIASKYGLVIGLTLAKRLETGKCQRQKRCHAQALG